MKIKNNKRKINFDSGEGSNYSLSDIDECSNSIKGKIQSKTAKKDRSQEEKKSKIAQIFFTRNLQKSILKLILSANVFVPSCVENVFMKIVPFS